MADRRTVLLWGLASWLVVGALSTQAQPVPAPPLIEMVAGVTEQSVRPFRESFLAGMRAQGHVEGRTFRFHARTAGGELTRLPGLIRESIAEHPVVLVVARLAAAQAARDATSTVPVVVVTASDLVDGGVVKSYARPGGNITGVSDLTDESAAKRLELLKAALPSASRVALLEPGPTRVATPLASVTASGDWSVAGLRGDNCRMEAVTALPAAVGAIPTRDLYDPRAAVWLAR